MSKTVNNSELISYDEETTELEIGKEYHVVIFSTDVGDAVCEFESQLDKIVIHGEEDKDDFPKGYIEELHFQNGVKLLSVQSNNGSLSIS